MTSATSWRKERCISLRPSCLTGTLMLSDCYYRRSFFSESNYHAQFLLPSLLSQLGGSRQFSRLKAFLLSLSYVYVGEFMAIMLGCFLSKSSKIVILTDSVMSLMRKNLDLGTVN